MKRPTATSKIYNRLHAKSLIGGDVSINDLREWEYSGKTLSDDQRKALRRFDNFRVNELKRQEHEPEFSNKYMELQVMANLSPYEEFLKEKYS
ncbi:MAG: hypothetical protein ACE5DN_01365 [Flavobacteriales bacterium]